MMNTKTLSKTAKAYLRKELREYMLSIGKLTAEEKKELRSWGANGNSVNTNPYQLYDESGNMVDFITGCRLHADICEHPDDYSIWEAEPSTDDKDADGLPF